MSDKKKVKETKKKSLDPQFIKKPEIVKIKNASEKKLNNN